MTDATIALELQRAFAMSRLWDEMAEAALDRDDQRFELATIRFNRISKESQRGDEA